MLQLFFGVFLAPKIIYLSSSRKQKMQKWYMGFLRCNLLNVSFSLPFFQVRETISIKFHWHFGHQSSAAGTCLPSVWMNGRVSERWTLSRPKRGTEREKKEAKWTHLFIQSSLCPIIQPLRFLRNMGKNQIFLPYIFFAHCTFLRFIIICSVPSSQILCLGRIN